MALDLNLKAPRFQGKNYSYWKERMEFHLEFLLKGIWEIIKPSYIAPYNSPSQTPNEMKDFENNTKDRVINVSFLSDEFFCSVVRLKTTK